MTCKRCRQLALAYIDCLRFIGSKEKVKQAQRKLLDIRKGNWRIEDTNTVYCLNADFEYPSLHCCYHLSAIERNEFFNIKKRAPKYEKIRKLYFEFRQQGYSEKDSCEQVSLITKFAPATVRREAHTRR